MANAATQGIEFRTATMIRATARHVEVDDLHPRSHDISVDRALHPPSCECQVAIESAVTKVMDDSEAVGWALAEILVASPSLADNVMPNEVDLEQTNFLLSRLFG